MKRALSILLLALLLQPAMQYSSAGPVWAQLSDEPTLAQTAAAGGFSQQYTDLTKKILLRAIELERFSLNFRLETAKQPKFRQLRYFLTQEAGAACGLTFEIIADDEFGKGRKHPLQISKPALHTALATATTGSIIAASGSGLELGLNVMQAIKNRRRGYDSRTANKYVAAKLKLIDQLLAQREALVLANADNPAHERAVIEGQLMQQMRNEFINEYSHFNADARDYLAFQNLFYILNAAYNTVGAVGAAVAYKAVDVPKLNGPANILFTVSGAMASVAPLLSAEVGKLARKHAIDSWAKQLHENPTFDPDAFATQCKRLEALPSVADGSLIPTLPATQRLAIYTQSDNLFRKQLDSETKTMRKLDKVAIQTSLLGPVIGGQLMTQGILGTIGYYKYTVRPRKQISQYYYGSIVGTVGTSMAVVGNAAWLLSSLSYEHKLAKKKQLPVQLIQERLSHLDDLEKTVSAI